MRFEQWAKNPTCGANAISAVHNVRMDKVAKFENLETTFGQSPFAIVRGNTFERSLFFDDAARLIQELVDKDVLPNGAAGFADLRLRINGGRRVTTLDQAILETRELLQRIAAAKTAEQRRRLPAVVAAATVRIPRGVMLPEAVLIIDALAIRSDTGKPTVVVGEIKTYPDRGGHTEPAELALARAQAGIYLHALQLVVRELGVEAEIDLGDKGFLVLSRPGSNQPSVRAGEDLRFQAERARRGFDLLERAALVLPKVPGDPVTAHDLLDAVVGAPTSYSESCLGFCDRAPLCFARARAAGDPVILGEDVRRFLGATTLERLEQLLDGAPAADVAEDDLLRRVRDAELMVR
jgi:hypothetical protein